MGLTRDLQKPDYVVVWSGERRNYLTVKEPAIGPSPARIERRAAPREQACVTDAWLAGEHYRETDKARARMHYSIRCANAPFTVQELAQAANVSKTLVRRFLDVAVLNRECRVVGKRAVKRTHADLFEYVKPSTVIVVSATMAAIEVSSN